LYSSSHVIRLIKEDEMGRAYSTYRRKSGTYRVLVGKSKGRRPQEIPDVDGKIILKWILKE
jgi:hypothetical protein